MYGTLVRRKGAAGNPSGLLAALPLMAAIALLAFNGRQTLAQDQIQLQLDQIRTRMEETAHQRHLLELIRSLRSDRPIVFRPPFLQPPFRQPEVPQPTFPQPGFRQPEFPSRSQLNQDPPRMQEPSGRPGVPLPEHSRMSQSLEDGHVLRAIQTASAFRDVSDVAAGRADPNVLTKYSPGVVMGLSAIEGRENLPFQRTVTVFERHYHVDFRPSDIRSLAAVHPTFPPAAPGMVGRPGYDPGVDMRPTNMNPAFPGSFQPGMMPSPGASIPRFPGPAPSTSGFSLPPAPTPGYFPPTPSYFPPTPSYFPPTPSYSPPTPSYSPPTPSFSPPTPR